VGRSLLEKWIKPSLLSDMDSVQLLKNVDGKASFVQADDDDMTQTTKSKIRFSTHDNLLWAHSSFPTTESDCIFFGPDTFRYFYFLEKTVKMYHEKGGKVIDIGAGSGAGGIFLANLLKDQGDVQVTLTDINPTALLYSRANATANFPTKDGPKFNFVLSDILKNVDGPFDLIVSNPPYMVDTEESKSAADKDGAARMYRNGGGTLGIELSVRIVREGAEKLNRGGLIALYTGIPILAGNVDPFFSEVKPLIEEGGLELVRYEEIDPDVWGEELSTKAYGDVERISVIGLVLRKK